MKKKIIKSKMIRSDTLQVDCDGCGEAGLSSFSDPNSGYGNGLAVGEEAVCDWCGQVYHWGDYVGVKITLTRGK